MHSRRYDDVLKPGWRRPKAIPETAAEVGLVVEEASTGFCGAVVEVAKDVVVLSDRRGRRRTFPLTPAGFLLDGHPVTLVRTATSVATSVGSEPRRSPSGSIAVEGLRARVARASRIYVEGRHDAELVERVWGHDLRVEGVVVEYLEGIDDLPAIVADFAPGPGRRLGVLVDHLVAGTKESRIAGAVASPHLLVVGHPYIDIWAAVKPTSVGISGWPDVPRGQPWKEGVCQRLGWEVDPALAWKRILGSVRSWADLDPALLGRVEELIDFVTHPEGSP